jgi:hypothetical protein
MLWRSRLHFKVHPNAPKPFEGYFWTHHRNLQRLLSLLVGRPVYPHTLTLKHSSGRPVAIYSSKNHGKKDKKFSRMELIAPYRKLKDHWPEVVKKWFDVCVKFEPTVILFFNVRFEGLNIQADFLRRMQAIEAFHKLGKSGTFVPEADFEKIKDQVQKAIPKEIPPELRHSLCLKIKYGNELTFKQKLAGLIQTVPARVREMIK